MKFDPPLSIFETAAALNISRTAVYEILARGEMIAVKLNGKTLIRSTEVERYFESLPKATFQPLSIAYPPDTTKPARDVASHIRRLCLYIQ